MAEAARRIVDDSAGYEADTFAWALEQARLLRAGALTRVDIENVAEEIESLGTSQKSALSSELARIVHHLLKLDLSPAVDPTRGWRVTVAIARQAVSKLLKGSPSLRPLLDEFIDEAHQDGRKLARVDLDDHRELSREIDAAIGARRYTAQQLLDDWWPDRR